MGCFDRNKICYHDVTNEVRNGVMYWVEVFGDGTYYAAYVGLSEEDPNLKGFESTIESAAIEEAIKRYEQSNKPLH